MNHPMFLVSKMPNCHREEDHFSFHDVDIDKHLQSLEYDSNSLQPTLGKTIDLSDKKGSKKRIRKHYEKRGFLANYLTSLSNEQLVNNTLTGFLIILLKERGPMTYDLI